jgi:hypothetical protein
MLRTTKTATRVTTSQTQVSVRAAISWGVPFGVATAAAPLAFWWLPTATVYAMGLTLIAAVYVGLAVADGRWRIIAAETSVAVAFVVMAAVAVTGSAWLPVAGLAAHGLKDLWQHRTQYVTGTRWWPPFCVTVDWVAALILTAAILTGPALR